MNRYDIPYTEVVYGVMTVEANNADDALEKAMEQDYYDIAPGDNEFHFNSKYDEYSPRMIEERTTTLNSNDFTHCCKYHAFDNNKYCAMCGARIIRRK